MLQQRMSGLFAAPRILTVSTLLMVAVPPIQPAWACSLASFDAPTGPLGTSPSGIEREGRVLPSNALFMATGLQIDSLRLQDGTRVDLEQTTAGPNPPAGSFLFAPSASVAGVMVEFESSILTFSEQADTTPAARPVLDDVEDRSLGEPERGCMETTSSSCDGVRRVDAELLSNVSDNVATVEHLVFAIYSGESAEEATKVTVPEQWVLNAEDDGSVRLLGLRVERGSWVAVSVIDEAGNESERSEAVRVR